MAVFYEVISISNLTRLFFLKNGENAVFFFNYFPYKIKSYRYHIAQLLSFKQVQSL